MNILLLGSGGREHAMAWKMVQSEHCHQLFIAPGNAGTSQCGKNVNISVNDFDAIKNFSTENNIELIVVGPEEPLVKGIFDYFNSSNNSPSKKINVMGPSSAGAQLEGSKAFSKKFMQRHNVPTASYGEFTKENFEEGKKYIQQHSLPVVLKADGLAAGKGVVISNTHEEALKAFEEMIIHEQFGEASSRVVIEQHLDGIELSVFVLTDGKNYKIIGHAKDYKRIGEGDRGLNTGGMGCVSPLPFVDEAFMKKIETRIIQPTVKGLEAEKIIYKGFIFFGLIKVNDEPFLIEYNCRMGDPETEVVLPRLKNDLVELFLALENGALQEALIEFDERACATIVAVSAGYPGTYEKNKAINFPGKPLLADETIIFHAGTTSASDGRILTNGGRVLAITSFGRNIADAAQVSRDLLAKIDFEGMYYRRDIGYEFEK